MDILDELYILDENKQPIKPESLEQWSDWRKNENNINTFAKIRAYKNFGKTGKITHT